MINKSELKLIKGTKNYYASKLGKIYKVEDNGNVIELRQCKATKSGYRLISIPGASSTLVHRLVMEAFNPINKKMAVTHLDFNKDNNRLDNLAYSDLTTIMKRAWGSGRFVNWIKAIKKCNIGRKSRTAILTEAQVKVIRKQHANGEKSTVQLAFDYGVSVSTVYSALKRWTWKHVK